VPASFISKLSRLAFGGLLRLEPARRHLRPPAPLPRRRRDLHRGLPGRWVGGQPRMVAHPTRAAGDGSSHRITDGVGTGYHHLRRRTPAAAGHGRVPGDVGSRGSDGPPGGPDPRRSRLMAPGHAREPPHRRHAADPRQAGPPHRRRASWAAGPSRGAQGVERSGPVGLWDLPTCHLQVVEPDSSSPDSSRASEAVAHYHLRCVPSHAGDGCSRRRRYLPPGPGDQDPNTAHHRTTTGRHRPVAALPPVGAHQ